MSDSYNGFAFRFSTADVNSPGGRRYRQLLVVAKDLDEAFAIAARVMPGSEFEDFGPEILDKARARGIGDGGAGVYDPNP